jgi:hypothetical protein
LPNPGAGLNLPVYVAVIDLVMSSESEFELTLDRLLAARRGASA